MPTRSCAASCRESPTRLSTASKWFSPNWPNKFPTRKPLTPRILSTLDFSKSSIVPAISMDFTVKLSIHWRALNNGKIGPQLAKRILEDILATYVRLGGANFPQQSEPRQLLAPNVLMIEPILDGYLAQTEYSSRTWCLQ